MITHVISTILGYYIMKEYSKNLDPLVWFMATEPAMCPYSILVLANKKFTSSLALDVTFNYYKLYINELVKMLKINNRNKKRKLHL